MQQNRHRDPAQKTSVGKFDGKYLKSKLCIERGATFCYHQKLHYSKAKHLQT